MFLVLLKFATNKPNAGQFMQGHKDWIKSGFDDGIFLMSGSIQPNQGGSVLAHNITLAALKTRVDQDPFVVHNIVIADIIEIAPTRTDPRLNFLIATEPTTT